ncbi:MAG: hypothetical protein H0T76_09520 [Nannocystis sp.]|nr:hypothetical protein [Nannocystis sp.]MBA3546708.1 hypothetical protein [Nannocystis sp.]
MSLRARGLLCVALGLGSPGCERVQAWFGEPRAEVEAPLQFAAGGVSFDYPGNWQLHEEIGESGEVELRTLVLESRGDAMTLIQVFRPALPIDLDEHLALTMRTLIADFTARGGGVAEVEAGAVTAFERWWLGAERAARRASMRVAMPGEEVASALELHAAQLAGATVLVFTMVPDGGRARAAAGFDLVLDTLAVADEN